MNGAFIDKALFPVRVELLEGLLPVQVVLSKIIFKVQYDNTRQLRR